MSSVMKFFTLFTLLAFVFVATTTNAQHKESEDKTLSPYFFIKSNDQNVDQLPLKSTSAVVNIAGVIADVKVAQVYKNEGRHALEAIYVFPASTRAAVYGMKMTIGKRVINAKIKKRDEARQDYEQAKQQGKGASLLEQQRPNVFQMNVANIMPGEEIKVEMSYTELLVPTNREYEFIYPTVVGPRYSNQKAESAPQSERWVQNPYLHQGEAPNYTFDISVNINAGMNIQKLACTSHKVNIKNNGSSTAVVTLDKSEAQGGNRDYILKYRLAGDEVQSGLLLYPGDKENFFLFMLQPPKRVTVENIPGREYIFIVDVSGSMHGYPLEISKKLLKDLIGNLRSKDRFNVLLFSGGSTLMSERSLPATSENINRAIAVIDQQRGGGGTELLPALKRALSLPRPDEYSRTVVIATDGYVRVEEEAFDLIRNNLGNANMFAFGIGSSVNRHIIAGMAHVGMGEPFIITKPDEAPAKAEAFRILIQSPVLTQIKMKFNGFNAYDVEPLTVPDVLADRPIVVFGKYRGQPHGTITVTGITGKKHYSQIINASAIKPLKVNLALQYLWARHRIMLLSDYNMLRQDDKRIKEVTDLGLTYNLLTAYTSFVAIDSEVRNESGKTTAVNQPLPLPEGVSDYAMGAALKYAVSPSMSRVCKGEQEKKDISLAEPSETQKGKDTISVKLGGITTTGGISKEEIEKIIKAKMQSIHNCIANKKLKGNIVIKLVIQQDGAVKSIKFVSDSLKNKAATQCIVQSAKTWRFNASSIQETTATVTFILGS